MIRLIRENLDMWLIGTIIILVLAFSMLMGYYNVLGQTPPRAIITWDSLQGATSYNVKRGITATTLVSVGTPTTNAFKDDTIDPTTKYYFAVAGVNDAGEGATGQAVNNPFRFSDIQPASPANVVCTQTKQGNKATLNCAWGVVNKTRSLLPITTGTVTYKGFLANTGSIQTFTILSGTSIQIGSLPRHQTFYFYVTAVWNGIESLGSPANRQQT